MPVLTKQTLNPDNLGYYVDWKTLSRGQQYHRENRVLITYFDGASATCRVRGELGSYSVSIHSEPSRKVSLSCTCPQAEKVRYCKHMVAAMLTLRDYIESNAENQWQYRLSLAIENSPRKGASHTPRTRYILLFGLSREKYPNGDYSFRLLPYRIRMQEWRGGEMIEAIPDAEARNQFLDQNRSWTHAAESNLSPIDYRACLNLPLEGVGLYNLMAKTSGGYYHYGIPEFGLYLPMLAKLNAPVFLTTPQSKFKERLQLLSEQVTIEAALAHEGSDFSLHAGLRLNGSIFTTVKDSLQIVSQDPPWVLAGHTLAPVSNPEALSIMRYFPLVIPQKDEREFREQYLLPIVERIPVQGDVVFWQDVETEPVPRLYISDDQGSFRAVLRFGYGNFEVEPTSKVEAVTLRDVPDSWGMVRIHRQINKELGFSGLLVEPHFGLKRAPRELGTAVYELRSRTHPFDFLLHSIPLLTKAGFEIFGEEKLKVGKINRATPRISLNIRSGLDWFDLQAVVQYGDQQVLLRDVRKALRKNQRYIKLADGSVGQIPEEWLERYKTLFELAEETENGLRITDFHLPLVDTLLADAEQVQTPADFIQRRQRLQGFERIDSQPIPTNFQGELWPYQKAGLDWLHFLHQYGFGGCLADDMGLGKTIQVLAFLQSLREQGLLQKPSLLVVPKSLLANWQREASRFTPDLRILEYFGNTRKKESAVFNQYDLILTTYGILLRDIVLLRAYRFEYAILDESQAIKNPLAQSAKAARLINAQSRLVMTGTPVENNTLELWSQFAFLNPGLLGSLEYFKREFAVPIENRENGQMASTLRKLVFPFILRRTKQQVAPELPPRTEQILYTDMEPAQRKLYNTTRDRYRLELLGVIESKGMDNARMKILEGLLRLRQICIHPKLVEPAYRGKGAKFDLLFETLETLKSEGHKALVFSQFVETLKFIRAELDARRIRYAYLDGQTRERQEQVDFFQNTPSIPFFLISLRAGGVGLNLTAADYVIHLDPWWNPAVEMQAADRAHRIGQDKPVFVYKIITRDTVEEKILQLQERKKELVEQLISAEGSFFKSITTDDVKLLFS